MSKTIDFTALKGLLSPKRLTHSIAVAQLCHQLNEQYDLGLDSYDLTLAGLGHDIARSWSEEELRTYVARNKISLYEGEEPIVDLLHAPVGAHLLKTMGADEAVSNAVRYHTIGSTKMGTLGFTLFAGDYLDPNRTFLSNKERSALLAERTIEDLVLHILSRSTAYLQTLDKPILAPTKELITFLEER